MVTRTFRSMLLLCFLSAIVAPNAFAESPVGRAEQAFADASDAYSIMGAIDSGIFQSYRGKDRAAWEQVYLAKRKETVDLLAAIPKVRIRGGDVRAVEMMRQALEAMPESTATPMQANHTCKESDQPDLGAAALRNALYACFIEIGGKLEFEGKQFDRLGALSALSVIPEKERRKRLFLSFLPLWQAINGEDDVRSPYRRLIRAMVDAGQHPSPLESAAGTVGASPTEVERWLEQILEAWRAASGDEVIEPWDYYYRAAEADRLLSAAVPRSAMEPITRHYYADLGADLQALGVLNDLDPRPGKAPLAYTDYVVRGRYVGGKWEPTVVRVSANYSSGGLGQLNEFVHENGHAVHMMALRTRPAFMDLGDPVFYEAFADVPSWGTYEPAWQQKYLGIRAPEAVSMRSLFAGVMLDVAWSLFEIRMLHEPESDPNAVWTGITSRYLHIAPHPELSWWALRVQLVQDPGYMVNYGLGAVITADLRKRIAEKLSPMEAGDRRWYAWISEHLLRTGKQFETSALLRKFLGRPVSPEALLEQLKRTGVIKAKPEKARERE